MFKDFKEIDGNPTPTITIGKRNIYFNSGFIRRNIVNSSTNYAKFFFNKEKNILGFVFYQEKVNGSYSLYKSTNQAQISGRGMLSKISERIEELRGRYNVQFEEDDKNAWYVNLNYRAPSLS